MACWRLLSLTLDFLVGTKEVRDIRQDKCKILDCAMSIFQPFNRFYTGSKAEGLDLPGSDDDFMIEINNKYNIKVIQTLIENPDASPYCTFFMSTENVPTGFVLLQHVPQTPLPPFLYQASQIINGLRHLSSDLFIQNRIKEKRTRDEKDTRRKHNFIRGRQGPSITLSVSTIPDAEPEDNVDCIHCAFWPSEALEWRDRPRHFGWPTPDDLLYTALNSLSLIFAL